MYSFLQTQIIYICLILKLNYEYKSRVKKPRGMLTVNPSPFPTIYDILIKWWYHGGTMNFLMFSRTRESVEKQRVPVAQQDRAPDS